MCLILPRGLSIEEYMCRWVLSASRNIELSVSYDVNRVTTQCNTGVLKVAHNRDVLLQSDILTICLIGAYPRAARASCAKSCPDEFQAPSFSQRYLGQEPTTLEQLK